MERASATLSGGEAQRIRLATQIGSSLVGVLYILDEPSIGLHQRDNERLIATLERLRDLGNTVLVVEHDEGTMRAADHLIDMGPAAGEHGGHVVAAGTADEVMRVKESLTGQFLARTRTIERPGHAPQAVRLRRDRGRDPAQPQEGRREGAARRLLLRDRRVGLGQVHASSTRSSTRRSPTGCTGRACGPGAHKRVRGIEQLDKIISVDQSPIGRTPRSNPATYIGLFDQIRDLFSKTQEARARGYKPGRFSFNVKGGRCEVCRGDGQIKIEMHFLPDVYVPCEQCHGKRYNRETLDIRFKGKTIADVLDMPIEEAIEFFAHIPKIKRRVQALHDVGLDYMRLGQPATTLSGGEAQRVKLASELSKVATGKTLYILDEPTTGLHFADIQRLLEVLQRLVDQGNSVVVIEHNLDVIKTADRIIDMGPEGGEEGGRLVASGTPEEVAAIEGSYTGRFLAGIVEPPRAGPAGAAAPEGAGGRVNVDWLLTTQGRLARIAGGTLLILLGLGVVGGFIGVLFLILGAIPIASAAYGALLIGPLFGRDTMGRLPEDQPEDGEAGLGRRGGGRGGGARGRRGLLRRRRPRGRPGLERPATRPRGAARGPGAPDPRPPRGGVAAPHPPKRERSACTFATYFWVSSNRPRDRTEPRPW